jgi:ribosomal protein S18 acetylase RimI-like enzyme
MRDVVAASSRSTWRVHLFACAGHQQKDYRSAARVQLRAVLDGYRHIFPPELPRPTAAALEAEWEIILRRDDLVVLVAAISRNEVIGTIVVSIDGSMGRVSRLHVDPAFWSRGAGQSLLQSAVEYLRAQGCKSAVLWVLRENHRARHLYDHPGWRADRHVTKSGPHDPRDSVLTPVAGRLISGDQPQGSPPIRAQRKNPRRPDGRLFDVWNDVGTNSTDMSAPRTSGDCAVHIAGYGAAGGA